MKEVTDKIHAYSDKHKLFHNGEKVIVAVSGGPDSMALLHYLLHEKTLGLRIEAAHVDHMLRGKESAADLAFVKRYCEMYKIPFHAASINVKDKMSHEGIGLQEAAREVRYTFFLQTMQQTGATKLVLGHHADDQIETVLFRLTRGSTMKGRAGIQPKRPFGKGNIVRPLLCISRSEIEQYCEQHGIETRTDPSNSKDDYTRNRLRHHIIPLLKKENPSLHEHMIRYTEEMTEDELWLEKEATGKLKALTIDKNHTFFKVDQEKWHAEAPPLQRRMIHLILNYLYAIVPTSLSSAHTTAVKKLLAQKHPSGELHLPQGLLVTRSYSSVTFSFAHLHNRKLSYNFQLDIGEKLKLPNGGTITVTAEAAEEQNSTFDYCKFDAAAVQWPLTVRTRQDGDRIELSGMNGSKKIKKLFIDEKVPRDLRASWPIVTDAAGRVLWIPGLRIAKGVEKPKNGNRVFTLIYYKDLSRGT
ncbi:tRNA lysidine(34) synthetase TilS [Jeotgalibacillus sp. S-D1]|uniref:tRNA lysidine(34) synthetase TilS n=1 Tax=Jeotgalibacillus sp. S-D1 TaxID=2552189 RepID=UPI00105931DD|nr:tRNA lysidine(34) synthetase TilS [Jeotgalibacillus sp. S-D1]TDL30407.1 tRNA lysidine(34) synthetase TilS [Jeotgalibacillus sp. S-D1]